MSDKPKPAATNDSVPLKGKLKIELVGPDGKVKDARNVDNLVVTVGKNALADQILAAPTFTKPTHMAVGSGSVAAALGDTALGTELARVAFTSKTRANNVVTYVGDYAAGTGTGALTEAGIFDAAASRRLVAVRAAKDGRLVAARSTPTPPSRTGSTWLIGCESVTASRRSTTSRSTESWPSCSCSSSSDARSAQR